MLACPQRLRPSLSEANLPGKPFVIHALFPAQALQGSLPCADTRTEGQL